MADTDDPETKGNAGQITLMLYRIAIGPILLALIGMIWDLKQQVSALQVNSNALFSTTASLESWARETSKQQHYLEGVKDTILSGAGRSQEYAITITIPPEVMAKADEEAQKSAIERLLARAKEAWAEKSDDTEAGTPASVPAGIPQVQMQLPDYDDIPQMDAEAIRRYRASKTKGAK